MLKSARYYSPEMGRFISEDPIGLAGGDVNYFAYVKNNPCNLVDPLGLVFGIPAGESYGESAAEYYANITIDPNASYAAKAGAWVGGILSSLWMTETSSKTAVTLSLGYASAGWASRTGPWLGRVAYQGPHSGGPHQYRHLQIMIRTGKHVTRHIRIRLGQFFGVSPFLEQPDENECKN